MNIGDKVRLLHGREEGIVVGFRDNNLVEVEIEDGFRIPVLRSEVVVVAAEEEVRFRRDAPASQKTPETRTGREVFSQTGIYFAFLPLNDVNYALYLINNTDFDLPFTLGEVRNESYQGVQGGTLKRKTSVKVTELSTQNFEKWPQYVLQLLFFREGTGSLREPVTRKVRFRANTLFKNKTKAPLLNKDAYLMQLDQEATAAEINPERITETIRNNAVKASIAAPAVPKPAAEVDLHIEHLTNNYAQLSSPEIVALQLKTFETAVENAVANGMTEITFIHGVGSGTLRNELHRRLSKHPHVKFFEDARKEKFGYGATKVTLK